MPDKKESNGIFIESSDAYCKSVNNDYSVVVLGTIVYNILVIIGMAIFSILNLIYFNKRKHLFGSERIKPTEL
jgi:hypothetical protein